MKRFQYTLFDLDGTLWESGPGITKGVQHALHCLGIEEEASNLTSFIGPPLNTEFQRRYGFTPEKSAEAIRIFREYYDDRGVYDNRLYPGVRDMLRKLYEAGIMVAAASSKPQPLIDKLMIYFDIGQYFEFTLGSNPADELKNQSGEDAKTKIVTAALTRLCALPEHTAMVGDRRFDMQGAVANHVTPVGAGYGYGTEEELRKAGAVFVAPDVPKLCSYLLAGQDD